MTAHNKRHKRYDLTQPLTNDEAQEIKQWFAHIKPRDMIEEAYGLAARTLAAINDDGAEPDDFKPYAGMGWYSDEIVKRYNWLAKAKERNEQNQVIELAYEIGVLITEARLKSAWDNDVEYALVTDEQRKQGGEITRKASDAERRAIVEEILAERAQGVRDACRTAAKRFPEMGAKITFKLSYYNK